MREQLEQYIHLLFAGARDCEDIRQEILQNTLDRYDDLIAQGKVPEAAYRLAIAGIGDVNELLGTAEQASAPVPPAAPAAAAGTGEDEDTSVKKLLRAIAVGLYILCPIPLILLSQIGLDTLGVCILLVIVAVATVMILLGAKKDEAEEDEDEDEEKTNLSSPSRKLRKSIDSLIGSVTLVVYLAVSFLTRAWGITWVIFLISGALKGLVNAILDLKEAKKHED